VQLGIGQGSTAQLGLHMADSLVMLNDKVTSAGRALEQRRSQNRLLQEQIEAMEVSKPVLVISQAILVRALGTSWDRGVRRISLVRLCLGPPAVGLA
jgi:hypothetical protein